MMKAIIATLCLAALGAYAQQDIDLTGYKLVFSDEFNTLSVGSADGKGSAKWGDWPPYGPAGAFSRSHWARRRLGVDNGILFSEAVWTAQRRDAAGNNWESGLIASMDKKRSGFAQRFGYWSARMKMPNAGEGAWCAFWLASASGIPNAGTKGYEIDIAELYGSQFKKGPGGDRYNWVVHPWNSDGSQAPPPYEGGEWVDIPGGDAINQWHIYGCKVAPDFITFYIDGQEVGRKPTNLEYLNDPLYIIINYALRDPLTGEPFANKGRSSLQVDWVRAYSLPSNISIPPP
jgi:beta-glucanase (GH16 family)